MVLVSLKGLASVLKRRGDMPPNKVQKELSIFLEECLEKGGV